MRNRIATSIGPPGPSSSAAISLSNLTVGYGNQQVLSDINLEVATGEMLILLGPSGSGKTTLILSIAGFIQPQRGSIMFGDRDVTRVPPHRRNIGLIFQNYALFPHMDVASNIAYPLRLRRVERSIIKKKVQQALSLVRLSGLGDRRVDQLSGGQRQRVAVARSIVFEPSILLLDEPLSALDKNLREEMQHELVRIHHDTGATTISVTHDQREALTMGDRIALMHGGKIAQIDEPRTLYEAPRSRFAAEFLGDSNVIAAESRGGEVTSAGRRIYTASAIRDGACWVVIRPEKLRLSRAASPCGNRFSGEVIESVYQGESCLIRIASQNEQLKVRVPASDPAFSTVPSNGTTVMVEALPADTTVVGE